MHDQRFAQTIVLVAEDEPFIRSVVERVLQGSGYVVLAAEDGMRALQIAQAHVGPLHVLLTDLKMPELDGVSLAKRLRHIRPDVRVILMSGSFDRPTHARGGWTFLQKPFAPGALLETVRSALGKDVWPLDDVPEAELWLS